MNLVDTTGVLDEDEAAVTELTELIAETIEENIGMAMIFSIHSAVQVGCRTAHSPVSWWPTAHCRAPLLVK